MHQGRTTTELALKAYRICPCYDSNGATLIFNCWETWLQQTSVEQPSFRAPGRPTQFATDQLHNQLIIYTSFPVCMVFHRQMTLISLCLMGLPHFYIMVSEHSHKDHLQSHISPHIQSTTGIFMSKLYQGRLESQSGYQCNCFVLRVPALKQ